MARQRSRAAAVVALSLAALLGLSACSGDGSGDNLSKQWEEGSGKGYVEGDGSSLSIPPAERTEPVVFSGETEHGDAFGSDDTLGSVTVVNFWYAGCAPCRAEAPDLEAAHAEYAPQGVKFVGVNTRDQAAQAVQFAEEFGVEYPSIMDNAGGRSVQRAFAGQVPLNAVPTTLVLDPEGRVAHRVLGQLASASHLTTLIKETLAETEESGAGSGDETDAKTADTAAGAATAGADAKAGE